MSTTGLVIVLVLALILFGGGGTYYRGPALGVPLGAIIIIAIIVLFVIPRGRGD